MLSLKSEIYFAQIREDSLVERMVLEKTKAGSALCIGSGGCTAFSILADNMQRVICVDNNAAQCALIELKKAAISELDHAAYLAFIGELPSKERIEVFCALQHLLSSEAKKFWLRHFPLIEKGINKCGATELFYDFIATCLLEQVQPEKHWRALFECNSIDEQEEIYDRYFSGDAWNTAIRILLSKQMHLQFFPEFMFAQAATNDFSQFFLKQFEREVGTKLLRGNYFLSQFIFGNYHFDEKEGMPFYLSEEGFAQAKRNIHKLEVVNAGINEACNRYQGIDAFLLSNVFDWCTPAQRVAVCEGIARSKAGDASVLYRTMLANVDAASGFSIPVQQHNEFSAQLRRTERSMMYDNIHFLSL